MQSVPDQVAGQTVSCAVCNQTFQVPALPSTPVLADLPLDIPLVPEPEPPALSTSTAAPLPPVHEEQVYRMAPEPPRPAPAPAPSPPPPRREERLRPAPAPQPSPQPQATKPPPSPLPAGYVHTRILWISPRTAPWISLVSLALLFILLFFSWTGAYPGGYGVYTQSGFQAIFGSYSTDPVGEKVLAKEKEIQEYMRANWFRMGLYFLLVVGALVLAVAPKVLSAASLRVPPALQAYWPWRSALLAAAVLLAFVILLIQLAAGFGLEQALATPVAASLETERGKATTTEERQQVDIKEGLALGRYNLHRTGWLSLAEVLNFLALVGVLLEIWLDKRGARPMPRVEMQW
jgi:hypothetical protein